MSAVHGEPREPSEAEWLEGSEDDFFDQEWHCTHCGGEGTCEDNANPLWDCDDNPHPCHSCGGSGKREDQRVF